MVVLQSFETGSVGHWPAMVWIVPIGKKEAQMGQFREKMAKIATDSANLNGK